MNNAEKFEKAFGLYATELWAMSEKDFLEWLNADVPDINVGDITVSCSVIPNSSAKSAQNVQDGDLISRKQAIEEISKQQTYKMFAGEDTVYLDANDVGSVLASLPSAQPVLTCDGCKYKGTYSTDMPCRGCLRREEDLYVPE